MKLKDNTFFLFNKKLNSLAIISNNLRCQTDWHYQMSSVSLLFFIVSSLHFYTINQKVRHKHFNGFISKINYNTEHRITATYFKQIV